MSKHQYRHFLWPQYAYQALPNTLFAPQMQDSLSHKLLMIFFDFDTFHQMKQLVALFYAGLGTVSEIILYIYR